VLTKVGCIIFYYMSEQELSLVTLYLRTFLFRYIINNNASKLTQIKKF